jgi:hypothetical protein
MKRASLQKMLAFFYFRLCGCRKNARVLPLLLWSRSHCLADLAIARAKTIHLPI